MRTRWIWARFGFRSRSTFNPKGFTRAFRIFIRDIEYPILRGHLCDLSPWRELAFGHVEPELRGVIFNAPVAADAPFMSGIGDLSPSLDASKARQRPSPAPWWPCSASPESQDLVIGWLFGLRRCRKRLLRHGVLSLSSLPRSFVMQSLPLPIQRSFVPSSGFCAKATRCPIGIRIAIPRLAAMLRISRPMTVLPISRQTTNPHFKDGLNSCASRTCLTLRSHA